MRIANKQKTIKAVISKIIYRISIIFILAFLVVSVVMPFTPLEFANGNYKDSFEQFRFFGFPLVLLLTLFGTIKSSDSGRTKAAKIFLTICVSVFALFFLFASAFAGMCSWTDNKILFENINNERTRIVLKDFGCGATDSGSPVYKVCKVKNISPFFIWVTSIDTSKIDKKNWQRVDNK